MGDVLWPLLLVSLWVPLASALRLAEQPQAAAELRVAAQETGSDFPWLRFAWAAPAAPEAPEGTDDRLQLLELRGEAGGDPEKIVLDNFRGYFGGIKFFIAALTRDLPQDLEQELIECSAAVHGGGPLKTPHRNASVWVFVNGETKTGETFWRYYRPRLRDGDKAVILGTWWNETHESFRNETVSSIWVPFASTSFAERKYHTPLDLVNRRNRTRFGGERRLVAYQQHTCKRGAWGREVFWDQLNAGLALYRPGLKGAALGACNGYNESGERLELPRDGGYERGTNYDASVGRYQNFRFVWASEHGLNAQGYVTEKLVNAFLAGAVPLYAGLQPEQLRQVFDTRSLIQLYWDNETNAEGIRRLIEASEDEETYRAILRPDEPVVSDAAMRRFFSWHPDTWERYGDGLRQTILREALAKCRGQ